MTQKSGFTENGSDLGMILLLDDGQIDHVSMMTKACMLYAAMLVSVPELLGTVDYVMSDETVAFRTCPKEKGKVIFQMVRLSQKSLCLCSRQWCQTDDALCSGSIHGINSLSPEPY